MEGRKISFVVLAMAGLLTACGSRVWGDDSEISTALAFGEAEACYIKHMILKQRKYTKIGREVNIWESIIPFM